MSAPVRLSDKAVVTHVMVVVRDGDAGGTVALPIEEFAKLFTAEKVYGRPHGPGTYIDTGWYLVPAGQRQGPAK